MINNNTIIENYLIKVKLEVRNLANADDFLKQLRNDIYEYAQSNSNFSEDDLISEFGLPKDIAKDYLDSVEAITIKNVSKRNAHKDIIISVLLALILIACLYVHSIS